MVWIFCTILAVMLLALSVMIGLNKRGGSLRVIGMLVCLFAATYAAYLPIYLVDFDTLSALIGNVIRVLQVITIDADIMDFYDVMVANIGGFSQAYMVLLGILHVAMPSVSALTAVTVLFRCFSSVQLFVSNRNKRPLFVFSELNERSLKLAKNLNIKCDIVFANSAEDSLGIESEKNRFIFKEEPISEIKLRYKKGKDTYLFCLSEDEDVSLAQSLQLMETLSARTDIDPSRFHIYQFSKYQDFSVFVDSANKGTLDVQCVNEHEMLLYNLLNKYPLFRYATSRVHVLLHGLSSLNIVALKAIAWCGQLSGYSLKISVVGTALKEQVETLKLTVPGLFTERYDIHFYDCESENQVIDTIREHCADANYIIVSEACDNDTMNVAVTLRRLFYKINDTYTNCPPIFCHVKDPSKFNIVKNLTTAETKAERKMSYDLIPFGSLDEVYTYEALVDSDLEKLAKNVHLAYEEIFGGDEINVKDAIARYNVFEVNKRSNRANALHIRYKLNLLGLDYTDDVNAEAVELKDFLDEERLERLAISEHDRWMAFLETEGWEPASKQDVSAYRESGISKGRHNCPLLKMHPYICDFEKLKELSLEIEGKDTTVYDRELILRIPDILKDKWHVSGKTYKIVKLP